MKVPLKEGAYVATDTVGLELMITVLSQAMDWVLKALQEGELNMFHFKRRKLINCNCVLVLLSYCCNIPDNMYMWELLHAIVVKRRNIGFLLSVKHIANNQIAFKSSLKVDNIVRRSLLHVLSNNIASVCDKVEVALEKKKRVKHYWSSFG